MYHNGSAPLLLQCERILRKRFGRRHRAIRTRSDDVIVARDVIRPRCDVINEGGEVRCRYICHDIRGQGGWSIQYILDSLSLPLIGDVRHVDRNIFSVPMYISLRRTGTNGNIEP